MLCWSFPFQGGKDAEKERSAASVGPGSSAGLYDFIFTKFYSTDEETTAQGYKLAPDHETGTWKSQIGTWSVWSHPGG